MYAQEARANDDTEDDDTDDNGVLYIQRASAGDLYKRKKRLPCVETSLLSGWGTRLINCDFEKERVPAQIAKSPLFTNVSLYPFIALDLIKTR